MKYILSSKTCLHSDAVFKNYITVLWLLNSHVRHSSDTHSKQTFCLMHSMRYTNTAACVSLLLNSRCTRNALPDPSFHRSRKTYDPKITQNLFDSAIKHIVYSLSTEILKKKNKKFLLFQDLRCFISKRFFRSVGSVYTLFPNPVSNVFFNYFLKTFV